MNDPYFDYFCWDMAKHVAGSEEAVTLSLFNSIKERFNSYLDQHFITMIYQPIVTAEQMKAVQVKLINLAKKEMLGNDKKETA